MARRGTREVFEDHLALRLAADLERDIERNYAGDVVLLTGHGVFYGHQGVRECARRLEEKLPRPELRYVKCLVDAEVAFLEWTARSGGRAIDDGVDTFLVRDGWIVVQTVHYTVSDAR